MIVCTHTHTVTHTVTHTHTHTQSHTQSHTHYTHATPYPYLCAQGIRLVRKPSFGRSLLAPLLKSPKEAKECSKEVREDQLGNSQPAQPCVRMRHG